MNDKGRNKKGKIEKKIDRGAFAGKILSADTKDVVKTIKCKGCNHSFDATFYTENPEANNIGYCPVCGGCDFEFVVRPRGKRGR